MTPRRPSISITAASYAALKKQADAAGMGVAAYVEKLIVQALEKANG